MNYTNHVSMEYRRVVGRVWLGRECWCRATCGVVSRGGGVVAVATVGTRGLTVEWTVRYWTVDGSGHKHDSRTMPIVTMRLSGVVDCFPFLSLCCRLFVCCVAVDGWIECLAVWVDWRVITFGTELFATSNGRERKTKQTETEVLETIASIDTGGGHEHSRQFEAKVHAMP